MKTFYLEFNAQQSPVGDAGSPGVTKRIRFWVVDRNPDGALRRAHHYLVQNGWQPAELAYPPADLEAPENDAGHLERDCYEQAQRYGIAMSVVE